MMDPQQHVKFALITVNYVLKLLTNVQLVLVEDLKLHHVTAQTVHLMMVFHQNVKLVNINVLLVKQHMIIVLSVQETESIFQIVNVTLKTVTTL